jgi:hypothetical protein
MKYVIDDVVTSFSSRISSHRSAWPRMQRCMMAANGYDVELAFDNADLVNDGVWLVSTPMEFKGDVFNLFGGYTREVRDRIARVLDFDLKNIVALDQPIGDIERILRPRAAKTDFDFTESEWSKIRSLMDCEVVLHEELIPMDRVVIGDSHSISRFRDNTVVYRHDGLTLHGLLKRGLKTYLPDREVNHLVINAGNVDIRHHLLRREGSVELVKAMVKELKYQLEDASLSGRIHSYEVTAPYPIEFEGRRIPKTGYYKGSPFYGTREERDAIRRVVVDELHNTFNLVFTWPENWYSMDPELYAKTYMEKPGSVHLSPEFYEWDLVNNEENKALYV